MKKLTILAIILLTSVYSYSQEEIIPIPDYVNTLYVITPDGLKALEKQEASTKTKLKAATFIPYAGLLAGGTRSSVVLIGTKSSVRFNTSDIRFIYEPSVMVDPEGLCGHWSHFKEHLWIYQEWNDISPLFVL